MKQLPWCAIALIGLLPGCAASPTPLAPAAPPPVEASASCVSAVPGADAGVLRACTEREQQDAAVGRSTNYEPFRGVVRTLARASQVQAERAASARATIVAGWRISCQQLRAEAAVICTARFTDPGLPSVEVAYGKGLDGRLTGPRLTVGHVHNCPGYAQDVRVDRNPSVRIRRLSGSDANLAGQRALTTQMESGTEIAVTSYEWPNCTPRSSVLPIPGFREAHNRLRQALAESRVD